MLASKIVYSVRNSAGRIYPSLTWVDRHTHLIQEHNTSTNQYLDSIAVYTVPTIKLKYMLGGRGSYFQLVNIHVTIDLRECLMLMFISVYNIVFQHKKVSIRHIQKPMSTHGIMIFKINTVH